MERGEKIQERFRDAITIPLPPEIAFPADTGPVITMEDLAASKRAESIGVVADPQRFSKSLGWDPPAPKKEFYIKAAGTDFILPPEYGQFQPVLRQIINHYRTKGVDGYCSAGILQAVINPDPASKAPFIQAHKDFRRSLLSDAKTVTNHTIYIVSDCLTTGTADITLDDRTIEEIRQAENPVAALNRILNQKEVIYRGSRPYEIIVFDSTTAHALANPERPTARTALIATFSGPEFQPAAGFGNPWLEAAVASLTSAHRRDIRPGAFPRPQNV